MSGPLLGGLLLQADLFGWGWRTILLINLPIDITALAGPTWLLRESKSDHAPPPRPWRHGAGHHRPAGAAVPAGAGPRAELARWTVVSMAGLGPAAGPLSHPPAPQGRPRRLAPAGPPLFAYRGVLGGLLVACVFFGGTGFNFVLTLLLQDGLGYSALATALTFLPFSLGLVVGSGAAMQLVPRLGRKLVIAGGPVMALGVLLMLAAVARYGDALQGWQVAPGQAVAGLGMALVASTLVNVVLAQVPTTEAGAASELVNTAIQIGVAAGIALIGAVLFSLLGNGDSFVTRSHRQPMGLRRPARRLRRIELPAPIRTNRGRAAQPARR